MGLFLCERDQVRRTLMFQGFLRLQSFCHTTQTHKDAHLQGSSWYSSTKSLPKWHHPPASESTKRTPFVAKEFAPTVFDKYISSVGNIDPNSKGLLLYNAHLNNIEVLHCTYFFTCSLLSLIFLIPVLLWIFVEHDYREMIFAVYTKYIIESKSALSGIGKCLHSCYTSLEKYQIWKLFECGVLLFLWLCITDRIRYRIFVNIVGKIWYRQNWLRKSSKNSWFERFITLYNVVKGKRKGRHAGLL